MVLHKRKTYNSIDSIDADAVGNSSKRNINNNNNYSANNNNADDYKVGHATPVYDSQSHASVLCTLYGSVWPHVLPYCIANVILTSCILILKFYCNVDLTFPSQGHTFMSVVLAFLVVSRSSTAYARFMEARNDLEDLYRSSKEIIHYMAVFSEHEQGFKAREWRSEVAYRTILLLRITMAALEHISSKKNTWEVPELGIDEERDVRQNLALEHETQTRNNTTAGAAAAAGPGATKPNNNINNNNNNKQKNNMNWMNRNKNNNSTQQQQQQQQQNQHRREPSANSIVVSNIMRWAHGPRSLRDENFRAPILFAYRLRASIVSHKNNRLDERLHVNQEREMLMFVSQYMTAYHGLRKLVTTPYPFPLIQMTRWFLLFWVFTLPFALIYDMNRSLYIVLVVFLITFAFMGLEQVSLELDDPFGEDPNDFNNLGMAQMVFEDIYITINTVDGPVAAQQLRNRITDRKKQDTPLGHYRKESMDIYHQVGVPLRIEWE